MVTQQQYTETVSALVGRLISVNPSIAPTVAIEVINDRIRTCLDRRPYWSGLFREASVLIPTPYITGNITLTRNSNQVTGTGVTWPVNDVVNTTIPSGVSQIGLQYIQPASMAGITPDTLLYVDGGGTPEIVPVVSTQGTVFSAYFNNTHGTNCTVTSSSFAGLQIRVNQYNPIFSIQAVVNSTTLILDMPWVMATQTNTAYSIRRMYFTISPDIKMIKDIVDMHQGRQILPHMPQEMINASDPQRSIFSDPLYMSDRGPNSNGNMQYELWPIPSTEKVLRVMYYAQWPKVSADDRLPYFLSPTLLYYGGAADVLRIRSSPKDPYYDPRTASEYEAKFERAFSDAVNADNAKASMAFHWNNGLAGMGQDWRVNHAPEEIWWNV